MKACSSPRSPAPATCGCSRCRSAAWPIASPRPSPASPASAGAKKAPCSAASATCWTETDAAVHLRHEGAGQGPPARPRRPQGHLALVPARRQDRRARPERRRQELAAEDHGGAGHRVPRRGLPRPGQHRRLPAAGADARSVEDGPRDRRRGRRRDARAPRPLRRDQREVRRGPVARGDGQGPRGAGQGPGSHRRAERLGPRLAARVRDGRAALPAARHAGDAALRRRAPPRRAVPPAAEAARSAAARRADQPPRRRVGGLAREAPQGLPGHRRRGDARSLLPRQRGRLDPRARSRQRHSVGRQLLVVARAEAAAAGARGEVREPAPAHAAARAGVDPPVAPGPPGQGQGPPQRLRAAAQRGRAAEDRQGRDLHRAGPAPRRRRGRGQGPAQGVRRHAADRRPELPPAARRHRRRHRPERRRQDHAVQDDRRPRAAGQRLAAPRRDRAARLRRSGPRARSEQDGVRRDHRRRRRDRAGQEDGGVAGLRLVVQLQGPRPAEEDRQAVRRRAQPRPPGQAAAHAARTCCCSTSRPTISTSTRCGPSRTRSSSSPAAPS